jgi:transcriptional regulator with PAS, ATPase and Fis domain
LLPSRRMSRVLLAWIGHTDLRAPESQEKGPIAEALAALSFDRAVLLSNYTKDADKERVKVYERWLKKQTKTDIVVRHDEFPGPTDYGRIYEAVLGAVAWTLEKYGKNTKLTFHLSPGTPAMTAIWIIVAKTRFEAQLIESSRQQGVVTVDVPFELAAEFIPAAVKQTSEDLARLAEGQRPEEPKFGDILHRSAVMKNVVRRARQAAPFSEPIYIEGASGTGKQLLAEAIHQESPRKGKPFVEVNCGSIPKELFESSFFGHKKGAFTGADRDQKGYFEQASGGTLFLDEVGELSLEHQVKLLRAIQQKKVRPVGATADVPIDVRIISATNRTLLDEVREGRFREDLYYRLAILTLRLPPLRDREGDLGYLIDKLLEKINAEHAGRPGAVQKKLSVAGKNLLLRHDWPGNVRELEGTLRRAYIWSKGATVDDDELRDALLGAPHKKGASEVLGRPLGDGFDIADVLHEVGHHYLTRAMKEADGNKTKAAALVGLASYQTLKGWLEKYGVEE